MFFLRYHDVGHVAFEPREDADPIWNATDPIPTVSDIPTVTTLAAMTVFVGDLK